MSRDYISYDLGQEVKALSTTRTIGRDREKLCSLFGVPDDKLIIPHQVHGDHVEYATVTGVEADAVWTNKRGLCIGVSTADCVPILLTDGKRIAAVHAGWRGTVKRIVQKTINEIAAQCADFQPEKLSAVIGPCISLKNFEVGDEVYEAFKNEGFDMAQIAVRYNKWHIDLQACNRLQLIELGVKAENIHIERCCTFDSEEFYSARREQKGLIKCGRNFNALLLR